MKSLLTFFLAGWLSLCLLQAADVSHDAGLADAEATHEETSAASGHKVPNRRDFEDYTLAVVVNSANELNNLSQQQVELVFSGDAQNWRAVSDLEMRLEAYAPGPMQSPHEGFMKVGLDDRPFGPNVELYDDQQMILAKVGQRRNAIGLVKYPFMRTEGVKIIAIDGMSPTLQNYAYHVTYDRLYPYAAELAGTEPSPDVHWSYEGDTGPAHWGDLDPAFILCKTGKEQSPIDIVNAVAKSGQPLDFHYKPSSLKLVNNGHTLKQDYDSGSHVVYKGKQFHLKQFHFHSKSEHTVNDEYAGLEVHLVHAAEDGELLVVGVMFNRGDENAFFEQFWKHLPDATEKTYENDSIQINAEGLLPKKRALYHYRGSLTTPPGTEGVNWFVFEAQGTLSPKQLATFREYYYGNYRPVQPLNGRTITLYKPDVIHHKPKEPRRVIDPEESRAAQLRVVPSIQMPPKAAKSEPAATPSVRELSEPAAPAVTVPQPKAPVIEAYLDEPAAVKTPPEAAPSPSVLPSLPQPKATTPKTLPPLPSVRETEPVYTLPVPKLEAKPQVQNTVEPTLPAEPKLALPKPAPAQSLTPAKPEGAHAHSGDGKPHWSYEGSTGPEHWGDLDPSFILCKVGTRQSPINLKDAEPKIGQPIEFFYRPSKINLINNGHTIQQNYDRGSYVLYKGKSYHLKQFHYHSKSEHTIYNTYSPLEMHLVHAADDGELLVVGVMFEEGLTNAFLQPMWGHLPKNAQGTYASPNYINASNVLPKKKTMFNYTGSLTTPPGTEGVNWFVFADPVYLSSEQLDRFREIYSGNYRPIQERNERPIYLYTPPVN